MDLTGNAYVTGYTYSTNFPTTTNSAFQAGLGGTNRTVNAFLVKVATQGTNLAYASYLGGTNFDKGEGVAVDAAGNLYIADPSANR